MSTFWWLGFNRPPPPTPPQREQSYGWRELWSYFHSRLGTAVRHPAPNYLWTGGHATNSWHYRESNHPERNRAGGGTDGCAIDFGSATCDVDAVRAEVQRLLLVGITFPEVIIDHDKWIDGRRSYYAPNDHAGGNRHAHIAIRPGQQLPI